MRATSAKFDLHAGNMKFNTKKWGINMYTYNYMHNSTRILYYTSCAVKIY